MRGTPAALLVALIVSFSGSWAETPEPERQRTRFARTTYRWPFASGPFYGELSASRRAEPGVLHTRVGSFDLRRGTPSFPSELRATDASRYAILQVDPAAFEDGRFDRVRLLLESQGGTLLEPMAVGAHVVRLSPALRGTLRAQDGVLALEPYHPAFKLAPTIGRVPLPDRERAISDVYRLEAMIFRGESTADVAASLRDLGAEITRVDPDVVFFKLSRERLADAARIEAVKAVFESLPNEVQGEETAIAVQTATWGNGASPFHDVGVRGEGQVLMVLDTGLQLDAGDLSDTRTSAGTPGPAHRKVLLYTTAVDGAGDALGCDARGFTHGHAVAATALGNATDVAGGYGARWLATDTNGGRWKLDGVAPRAKLMLYDAHATPSTGTCGNALSVGTLYLDDTPGAGSLGEAHARGARVFNFSWGTTGGNSYGTNAQRSDQFLFDHPDAALFVAAGNAGTTTPSTISDPATCKSCLVVGDGGNLNGPGPGMQEGLLFSSSIGPVGASGRIAPLLLAPGHDGAGMGLDSEYACRSSDDDQGNPVECDVIQDLSGTSYAAAAASGTALLVRDYFQQGFYPDGTSADPGNAADQVSAVSGALVKAVLVTSADFVEGDLVTQKFRFNREQGYGRIRLANALPLTTYVPTPRGMAVADGGIPGGRLDLPGLTGTIASAGVTQTGTLRVDGQAELRCALAWTEDAGDALAHDLDLELVSPTGKVYLGNFFTEDVDRDDFLDPGENCNPPGFAHLDQGPWSIDISGCGVVPGSRTDSQNPVEAIFLSPAQVESGDWSLRVRYRTGTGAQPYAVSCSGPIATASAVRFDRSAYACADQVVVAVLEASDPSDPTPTPAVVAGRTTVQVVDGNGSVRDTESGFAFTADGLRFQSAPILVTDGTVYDPGNGVLDVRHGDMLRVLYADTGEVRLATAGVDCEAHVALGGVVWATWGKDAATLVQGGCERDARNLFTFGFPDKFMDAGERLTYRVGFQSAEDTELRDFTVSLRCVHADADSPAGCPPGSTDCPDPDRRNNPACTEMTVLDSPRAVALVPAGEAISVSFNLEMAESIAGTPKVDMLLGITAAQNGRTVERILAFRHVLDVDETETFYSTDFPTGGSELRDFNQNETLQNPTTNLTDFKQDYQFETRVYGDLTAGGTKNTGLQAPWSFDGNDGGFRVGLNPASTDLGMQVVANWGEDKNFNGVLDPGEDRDPINGALDSNWSTLGGCGWQTKGANPTGGIWHTGGIGLATGTCANQCELVDVLQGTAGALGQWETLLTPVVQKVNLGVDGDGDPTHRLEITNWAWNMEMDLKTQFDLLLWELDTDTASGTGADLFRDTAVLNFIGGNQGPLSGGNSPLSNGFQTFAPFLGTTSVNGTAGNNRVGKNACIFEIAGTAGRQPDFTLGLAKPEDRSDGDNTNGRGDFDDDGDGLIDEFVTANGPIRNFDLRAVNGPDLRFQTLDDLYGDAGNSFQGALGFWELEGVVNDQPSAGYGVGVDDMVIEWREVARIKDTHPCASGACATLSLDVTNIYEGNGTLTVTVQDVSPWAAANPKNDCNGDGDYLDAADDQDCNDDGTQDVTVKASSEDGPAQVFALDRLSPGGAAWQGIVPFSTAFELPGTLHLILPQAGTGTIDVQYEDRDDGTGQRCGSDVDPAKRGFLVESTPVRLQDLSSVVVRSVRLTDNGDHDGFADPNETVSLFVTLRNNGSVDRHGLVVRLSTNDASIDCILQPVVAFGTLDAHASREATLAAVFRVANVTRSNVDADLTATFEITVSGEDFDVTSRPQRFTVDLDLNVSGGSVPTTFTEGFESPGFGSFTTQSLDLGKESLTLSNGMRCQYNDPELIVTNSNSYGNTFCFVGATPASSNLYDWHVHGLASPDGGRAYLGNNSLHWGRHPGAASADTTGLKQLDAIRTTDPVNLGWNGVTSELTFKHQVGLTDCDYVNCEPPRNVDRGIVQVQLASSSGSTVGTWRKVSPYENLYDGQAVDNYSNCLFDPTDDGNTEDDYFDPTDPNRRFGPSSTCYPEFSFSRQGAIFWSDTFDPQDVHHADGPGLQGVRGPGTWVETKFSLDRWRGRRLRLRFLATSIEVSDAYTMQQALGWNPTEADDGWYIDDVQVSNALVNPATVTVDTVNRTGLPGCGPVCTAVTAALAPSPVNTGAPGQPTLLDASASLADRCVDGLLQFRFWEDVNGNMVLGDAGDRLLRTWTENPVVAQAPVRTTRYGVEVRCSSLPTCQASASALVTVSCPSTGVAGAPFGQTIRFATKVDLSWPAVELVHAIRGSLGALRAQAGFPGTVEACLVTEMSTRVVTDGTTPSPGTGKYYLVRGAGPSPYCNGTPSWSSGSPREVGDRDAGLDADPNTCP